MSELEEFKKVVSPIAYGLAYKSELGTTEYQQLYAEEDVIKYFNNKPSLTIPKSIADELEEYDAGKKGNYSLFSLSEKAREFYLSHNDIVTIYFASKALGVDLVKVVEG